MAEDSRDTLLDEIEIETLKAKRALLKAIETKAPASLSAGQIADLSYAYAMLEGAHLGVLPGSAPHEKK
jgi:hypothetical protein